MGEILNISELTVLKANRYDNPLALAALGLRQSTTGMPSLSGLTYDDTAMHTKATAVQTTYLNSKASPPTATKEDVDVVINIFVDAYDENGSQIQAVARKQAKLAGDVAVGINIVKKAGYFLKSPKSASNKFFKAKALGGAEVWISTKAVTPGAGYIREYGLTTAKGIPPTIMMQLLFSMESDLLLTGLKVGGIYAMREASILPIPRSSGGGSEPTNVEDPATRSAISKNRKRIYAAADGEETSNYVWGDWIYFVVL